MDEFHMLSLGGFGYAKGVKCRDVLWEGRLGRCMCVSVRGKRGRRWGLLCFWEE